MKTSDVRYWDSDSPWWSAVGLWESDKILSSVLLEEIRSLRKHPHSRVAQLCQALIDLIEDEKATIARNDSLVRWLLTRRNAARLSQRLRLVVGSPAGKEADLLVHH